MCRFSDVGEIEDVLTALSEREDGPYVVRLAREPGRRESRYHHLFFGEPAQATYGPEPEALAPVRADSRQGADTASRLERLERQVADLQEELDRLKQSLGE
jgi:uncharacterized protein YceH (UPF0502 family)